MRMFSGSRSVSSGGELHRKACPALRPKEVAADGLRIGAGSHDAEGPVFGGLGLRHEAAVEVHAAGLGRRRLQTRGGEARVREEGFDVRDARLAGMSVSSFHKHFRETMGTSPLQYQKSLRLTEARRLLRSGEHSVSATAFEVGYASPSQFSREYTRTFGAPPRGDVGRT